MRNLNVGYVPAGKRDEVLGVSFDNTMAIWIASSAHLFTTASLVCVDTAVSVYRFAYQGSQEMSRGFEGPTCHRAAHGEKPVPLELSPSRITEYVGVPP